MCIRASCSKIYFMKKLCLLILFFAFVTCTYTQYNFWFKGTVVDEAGNAVKGASIIVKGKNIQYLQTQTNSNCEYYIGYPNVKKIDSVYSFTYKNPNNRNDDFYIVYKLDSSVLYNDTIICKTLQYEDGIELMEGNNIINFVLHKKQPENYTASFSSHKKYSEEEINFMQRTDKYKTDSLKELKRKLENNEPLPREEEDYDKIFTTVLIPATFPGGDTALIKFIEKNISYPDSATNSNFSGVVKVGFTINKNGNIVDIKLIKGVNRFADEEVFNVIKKMPHWLPAVQNGRNVDDIKTLSVLFNVKGYKESKK